MNAILKTVPRRQAHIRVAYRPLMLSLQQPSHEAICIGVVAREGEGNWLFHAANRLERLKCLFGATSGPVFEALDITQREIAYQLASPVVRDPARLRLPLSGFQLGELREASGSDYEGAIDNALCAVSSLHIGRFARLRAQAREAEGFLLSDGARPPRAGKLHNEVKREVVNREPSLVRFFGRVLYEGTAAMPPRVGFLSPKLVANFIDVSPRSSPASIVQRGQVGIHILNLSRQSSDVPKSAGRTMFLRVSQTEDNLWMRQPASVSAALEEIEFEASKFGVAAEWRPDAWGIAARLIESAHPEPLES